MKKVVFSIALFLGLVVGQLIAPLQVEAMDTYVGTWEGGWEAYLIIEDIDLGDYETTSDGYIINFKDNVKAVSPKGTVKYIKYEMQLHQYSAGELEVTFRDSLGGSGHFTLSNCKDYEVEARIALINREVVQQAVSAYGRR